VEDCRRPIPQNKKGRAMGAAFGLKGKEKGRAMGAAF
jgi:hypothetical protein